MTVSFSESGRFQGMLEKMTAFGRVVGAATTVIAAQQQVGDRCDYDQFRPGIG